MLGPKKGTEAALLWALIGLQCHALGREGFIPPAVMNALCNRCLMSLPWTLYRHLPTKIAFWIVHQTTLVPMHTRLHRSLQRLNWIFRTPARRPHDDDRHNMQATLGLM